MRLEMVSSMIKLEGILKFLPSEKIPHYVSVAQKSAPRTALFNLAILNKGNQYDQVFKGELIKKLKNGKHFIELGSDLKKWINQIKKAIEKQLFLIPKGPLGPLQHFASKKLNAPMVDWYNKHNKMEQIDVWYKMLMAA